MSIEPSVSIKGDTFKDGTTVATLECLPPNSYPSTPVGPTVPTKFDYLNPHETYDIDRPNLPIPAIQEVFLDMYQSYQENALVHRQKIDECLRRFKDILGLHPRLHMVECFRSWCNQLTNPVFTILYKEGKMNVKEIKVRADVNPREIWEAQKYIRELLYGCHLFLDQYDYFDHELQTGLMKVERLSQNLTSLETSTPTPNQEHVQMEITRLSTQYRYRVSFLSMFKEHIIALTREIDESVYILREPSD